MSKLFYFILEACKKLASVASGVPIEEIFEKTLPPKYYFNLNPTELSKLNDFRQQELKKLCGRKLQMLGLAPDPSPLLIKKSKNGILTNGSEDTYGGETCQRKNGAVIYKKVNIEYLNLLLPHLKHYNAACSLCIRTRYFGKKTSNPTSLLVKCTLKCGGKGCPFICNVYIFNNGFGFVIPSNPRIFHYVKERYSRPIRGSIREKIKGRFKAGGSVYRVHAEYENKRTKNEKKGFNYDATGKTKKVFKKIKVEATAGTLLSPNVSLAITALCDKLDAEINNDGAISGVIQRVQTRPFCVWAFTEASVRLYDSIVSHPESVLSWDATGGIIKNTESTSKQCLYYELTLSHPDIVDEDSLIPLTFMLSESQTLPTVIEWLTYFKEAHKKVR
jgi:hypothetical protein